MRHVRHLIALSAALVLGSTMAGATAAQAQSGYYVAVPAKQPKRDTLIVRETAWHLNGSSYVAARGGDRDATLCDAVARSAGALTSFTAGGRAFDAEQLAKCNAHAKGGAGGAAVAQAQ